MLMASFVTCDSRLLMKAFEFYVVDATQLI